MPSRVLFFVSAQSGKWVVRRDSRNLTFEDHDQALAAAIEAARSARRLGQEARVVAQTDDGWRKVWKDGRRWRL